MALELYTPLIYFLKLNLSKEVMWVVVPLFISTFALIIYDEKYKDERKGWNTYFSNSLILLFVSISLLRYIQSIDNLGFINYATYLDKTFLTLFLLLVGILVVFLNFEHFLPEKIASYITSPISINLVAYISILFVHSWTVFYWDTYLILLILFVVFLFVLYEVRMLFRKLFLHLKKLKEKELAEQILLEKKDFKTKKKEIHQIEKEVEKEKKQILIEEKDVKTKRLKDLDQQKKEVIKLRKLVKK